MIFCFIIKHVMTLDLPTSNYPSENMLILILVTKLVFSCSVYFSFVAFSAQLLILISIRLCHSKFHHSETDAPVSYELQEDEVTMQ